MGRTLVNTEMESRPASLPEAAIADWPEDNAFISLDLPSQFHDGSARCTRIAVLNGPQPASHFDQGDRADFFFEFAIMRDLDVPADGLELKHESGVIVHGKNGFQEEAALPARVAAGSLLRIHRWIDLAVMSGTYSVTIGLSGTDPQSYRNYHQSDLPYRDFHFREHCRVPKAVTIDVGWAKRGKLSHHGAANLPGESVYRVIESAAPAAIANGPAVHNGSASSPTVLHITHWKAGSQWIYKILRECAPGRTVKPEPDEAQVRYYPLQTNRIYPTVYLNKAELDHIALPENTRKFVVIRDLRDTLVSAYFSFKLSHPVVTSTNLAVREVLTSVGTEEGMLYLMEEFLANCARIQLSWMESEEPVLKYEDLLQNDIELLTDVLLRHCGLPIDRALLEEVIVRSRFEAMTGGRPRGQEEQMAHERKGIAGDWRNHFTPRVTKAFKARFGGLLVAAGYEKDLNW